MLAAYAFSVPVGIAGFSVGLFVRRGAKWLRAGCIALSLVVISLPFLATADLLVAQLQDLKLTLDKSTYNSLTRETKVARLMPSCFLDLHGRGWRSV